jgi:predicted PurR-regulated permease PerM
MDVLLQDVLGPHGLFSNWQEIHAAVMALVVAVLAIALDRRGHPRWATAVTTVAILVAFTFPSHNLVEYKSWYFAGPIAAIAGLYLIWDRADTQRLRDR